MASLRAAAALVVVGVAMWAAPVAAGATCTGDASWTAVTSYSNGYSSYAGTWAYRKDAAGFVHLGQGIPGGGYDNNVITVLPTGYRPAANEWFTTSRGGSLYSGGGAGQMEVQTDGTVESWGTGSNGFLVATVVYYVGPDCTGGSGGSSGMTNPMTTAQDLIVGGTSGAAGRLGVGTSGQVLAVGSGGVIGWATAASTSLSLSAFTGDALGTVNQMYSLILAVGALLVLGVGYTVARGLSK